MIDVKEIEIAAKRELKDEEFRAAVVRRKQELRERSKLPWYKRVFPFRIKLERI